MLSNKNKIMFFIAIAIMFASCSQNDQLTEEFTTIQNANQAENIENRLEKDESLIVLSAPSVYNEYYQAIFEDIIAFQADYANQIKGKDKVVILADKETLPYFKGKVNQSILLEANVEDIWIRDFAPAHPTAQVKFNYLPDFQPAKTSNLIDNSFEDWFYNSGLKYGKKTSLILDGGNVVDNGKGKIVVTDRFLYDNPNLTYSSAKRKLKQLFGATQVAIVPEVPGDATGHADGMMLWVSDNKILLQKLYGANRRAVMEELKYAFPNVEIVELPDYYKDETWNGFSSACNIFVNSLVTDKYIYMPTFDSRYDEKMLKMIQSHTHKKVVPITAEGVCFMGGSVRCLSWQMKGMNANKILELAK